MTHIDTEYNFQNNQCVMIYGKNLTDSGTDSNGTGKSTILEAISLAITGTTSRDIGKDDFINDDSDETFIQLDLSNNLGNISKLSIKRWFHRKKSSKIEIWENDIKNEEITSVNEANSYVYEIIGLNKEDILHFFIIGQESDYSFLTATDGEKKNIISRFSNIGFIDNKIVELKENRKDLEKEVNEFNSDIIKLENKNEFLEEQRGDIQENFESEKKKRINKLKKKIENKESELSDLEDSKAESGKSIKALQKEISKINIIDTTEIDEKIKNINKSIRKINIALNKLKQDKSYLNIIQQGKLKCPSCGFEFNPTDDMDISSIPDKINEIGNKIQKEKSKKINLEEKLQSLQDKREEIEEQEDELNSLNRKLKKVQLKLDSIRDEKEQLNDDINSLTTKVKKIKKEKISDKISSINDEISNNNEMIEVLNQGKKKIDDEIEIIDYWVYHFGKKGFTTFLTNKSVKSIEGITNSFLKKMNSNLQVQIDGFTTLKNGDIREKINVEIIRNGMKVGNFNRYSGGERGRIKLANILGLQKLINMSCDTGGFNFLGLDEVFEGLDQSGQKDVLNILENQSVTSLVVTHRNQPIGAENELFIAKIEGESKIVSEKSFKLAD